MNILSYDIEEWYVEKKFHGGRIEKYYEFDEYLDIILQTLDAYNLSATFFCVGKMAKYFPEVINKISRAGHEIGCHSNEHLWLTKMTPDILREDTKEAIYSLEDICGEKVLSYRAPAFSIGESNKWAFEILSECGIERDSSIFPCKRDFGGFASFPKSEPVFLEYDGFKIKEFPIALTHILGHDLAFSGGGYFRLFPYNFIKNKIEHDAYSIVYLHIGDLLRNKGGIMSKSEYEKYFKESGSLFNRLKRFVKSNLGTYGANRKMQRLLSENDFISLKEADSLLDWNKIDTVIL